MIQKYDNSYGASNNDYKQNNKKSYTNLHVYLLKGNYIIRKINCTVNIDIDIKILAFL